MLPLEPDIEELEGLAEVSYIRTLFTSLKNLCDSGSEKVSINNIQADTQMSRHTILKYARLLDEHNIITIIRTERGPTANIYEINKNPEYEKIIDKFTEIISKYKDA